MGSSIIETSTLEKVLEKRKKIQDVKNQMPWTFINFLGAFFVYLDLKFRTTEGMLWFFETITFTLLTLNFVTGIIVYLKRTKFDPPVEVSNEERKIYSINETEPGFTTSTPVKQKKETQPLPSPTISTSALHLSESQLSADGNRSADLSITSSSWHFQKDQSASVTKFSPSSRRLDFDDEIVDEHSLSFVLKELDRETERTNIQEESFTSLRVNQSAYSISDFSPMKKYSYQLSTLSPVGTPLGKSAADEGLSSEGTSSSVKTLDLWRQFGIGPEQLLKFTENIRMWITATILKPLVSEIDKINESLTAHGLSDSRIGEVGLEKLRKTSQIVPVAGNIPSLPAVLPYLEVTPHQDYLVHRLRELALGGCMSEYRWDGGSSSFKNKNWDESLPTDASIVLHCLVTYLDSQLPALTDRPDKGPFSGTYLVRHNEKPFSSANPLIVEVQLNPPHFKINAEGQDLEFPKGRNNLFHTLLLFFFILKVRYSGQLGRINLGPSGLNLLWMFNP